MARSTLIVSFRMTFAKDSRTDGALAGRQPVLVDMTGGDPMLAWCPTRPLAEVASVDARCRVVLENREDVSHGGAIRKCGPDPLLRVIS